ncbi:MAG: GGDEF domain-containing protein [Gammaproteobacteria bacterium]|nr:GGDEF domain-containing protein [Gammaproteobacteria bacterium]
MLATSTVSIMTRDTNVSAEMECRLPEYLHALPQYLHKQALNLLAKLHTSLDIEQLLKAFHQGIQVDLPELAFTVDCPDCYVPIPVNCGTKQWQFHIIIDDDYLCDLSLYSPAEIKQDLAEQLNLWLRVLAYPLRNAIHLHKMRMQVFRDGLTGVQNRIAMDQSLGREVASAQRHHTELSLLIIDIDHFKSINDRYGHSRGDIALQTTTRIMRNCLRNSDQIFRYGGEEFVILLTHTEPVGAYILAERIRQSMAEGDHLIGDIRIPITVSIGFSAMQWNDTSESLFNKADKALYTAKNTGRNQVCCLDKDNNSDESSFSELMSPLSSQA